MLRKDDLIERFMERGYTKKDAGIVIDDFIGLVTEALVNGETVQLHGFGTFSIRECIEHETVDMQTKKRIIVPAYRTPKFTAGKLLKRAVREGLLRV